MVYSKNTQFFFVANLILYPILFAMPTQATVAVLQLGDKNAAVNNLHLQTTLPTMNNIQILAV
eukprot:14886760-Ditylum_brightwellii.AAC.1